MKRILFGLVIMISPIFLAYKEDVKSFSITKVVIDAGHGGHDAGCLGSSSKEKEVTLAVALKLGKYIEENFNDVKVIYTRKTDVFVELHERASIANTNKADFFICIHCNSGPKEAIGAETYVMGLHKTEDNLSVAKRENASIMMEENYKSNYEGFDPNSPESYIAFSLYQHAFMSQSLSFASKVQSQLKEKTGRSSRGVKQAGFLVLYRTTMPSVLIETGFLTNSNEEKFLTTGQGQDQIASAIFRAFRDYKLEKDGLVKHTGASKPVAVSQNNDNPALAPVLVSKNPISAIPPNKVDTSTHKTLSKEKIANHKEIISKSKVEKGNAEKIGEKQKPEKDKMVIAKGNEVSKNQNSESAKSKVEPSTVKPLSPIVESHVDTVSRSLNVVKADTKILFTYSIQIGITSKPMPLGSEFFKGIDKSRIFSENSTDGIKYTVGNTRKLSEAISIQSEMRNKGFSGAFVVAYKNGKRIPLAEANAQIEK